MGGLGIPADSDQPNWVVHNNLQNTFLITEVPPPQKKKKKNLFITFEKRNPKNTFPWYDTGF